MSVQHNGAPDRFILCSGGKDSAALAHFIHEKFEHEQKSPVVVYFDTTIGLSAQRIYIEMLADHYNWYLSTWRTPENFEQITLEHGFYGQSEKAHNDIFQKLKGRQRSKITTISGNPHFYWGVYKAESEKRERTVTKKYVDERGATHHAPFANWTEQDIIDYLKEHQIPFNPLWECPHYTDCGCGSGGATREERVELEAEGFRVMAKKMDDLEDRVETGDRREVWAWGSFTDQERKRLDHAADEAQDKLASWGCGDHCSMPSLKALADGNGSKSSDEYTDPEAIGFTSGDEE